MLLAAPVGGFKFKKTAKNRFKNVFLLKNSHFMRKICAARHGILLLLPELIRKRSERCMLTVESSKAV